MIPFKNIFLHDLFNNLYENIRNEINNYEDNYILNVDENNIIEYLFTRYKIQPINLFFDNWYLSEDYKEKKIIPTPFDVISNSSTYEYIATMVKINIPYEGDSKLFKTYPSSQRSSKYEIQISNTEISFVVEWKENNANYLNDKINEIKDYLKYYIDNIRNEVDSYNNNLKSYIKDIFNNKKEKIKIITTSLKKLIVPLRRIEDKDNNTFSVSPIKKKEKISIQLPEIKNDFNLDPVISEDLYLQILSVIYEFGKRMEEYPNIYRNKNEETIRDYILLILSLNFKVSVMAEAFNRNGKTDILLKYNNENIFIAECKIWHGKKQLFSAINQLQSYLTWRDTKSALIIFVKDKNISSIIEKINSEIIEHPQFIKKYKLLNDYDTIYEFSFEQDNQKNFQLAILFYHLVD